MSVYLIHFDKPYKGKQHYIGESANPAARLLEHKETNWTPYDSPSYSEGRVVLGERHGSGAKFLAFLNYMGIDYHIVRIWEGEGRDFERRLKRFKCSRLVCPVCNPNAYNRMRTK